MQNGLLSVQKLWRDQKGQDLIEYALLTGFMAVLVGAAFPRGIVPAMSQMMASVNSCLAASL